MKTSHLVVSSVLSLCVVSSVFSQHQLTSGISIPIPPGDCFDEGVIHDDGTVESGYGVEPVLQRASFVEPFDAAVLANQLDRVCVCWLASSTIPPIPPDSELDYEVVIFDDDGPGAQPGTLLASISSHASEVPFAFPGGLYTVSVPATLSLPQEGTLYIGVEWNPEEEGAVFFSCVDEDQPPRGGFHVAEGVYPEWTPIEDVGLFVNYGSMIIRAGTKERTIEIPALTSLGLLAFTLFIAIFGLRRIQTG